VIGVCAVNWFVVLEHRFDRLRAHSETKMELTLTQNSELYLTQIKNLSAFPAMEGHQGATINTRT